VAHQQVLVGHQEAPAALLPAELELLPAPIVRSLERRLEIGVVDIPGGGLAIAHPALGVACLGLLYEGRIERRIASRNAEARRALEYIPVLDLVSDRRDHLDA
jgi:hypothetical protein